MVTIGIVYTICSISVAILSAPYPFSWTKTSSSSCIPLSYPFSPKSQIEPRQPRVHACEGCPVSAGRGGGELTRKRHILNFYFPIPFSFLCHVLLTPFQCISRLFWLGPLRFSFPISTCVVSG